ncbi:NIF family HAD-type phosphatase [Aeoliella sp.]|uniref:NIF family HAD-type phosphatase n=1 Tax=Aeoliella sp. TaxID=2795800 RepID=UPI003CCBDEBC
MCESEQRALLILDLDECLIHGSETVLHRKPDFQVGPYHVYQRPGLAEFLAGVADSFELAVWSSASSGYVERIAAEIRPVGIDWNFVWSCRRCTPRMDHETMETVFIKDLKKVKRLGFSLDRVLFVDDTPAKLARNYGNAVYIQPFEGNDQDKELSILLKYLRSLADKTDFRKLEKRGWRSHVAE